MKSVLKTKENSEAVEMKNTSRVVIRITGSVISLLILVLVVFGLIRAGQWAYGFGYRVYTEDAMESAPGTDKTVTVTADMSAKDVGRQLEEKGLNSEQAQMEAFYESIGVKH